MKLIQLTAAFIAGMTAITPLLFNSSPVTVFAEETVAESSLPDWVPADFGAALEFRNTYGTTHIQDGLVCLVFKEERECERKGDTKGEPHYRISASDGVMQQIKDDTYGTENSSSDYEVVVYKPLEAGDFEISLIDNWVKSSSLEPELGYVHYLAYHTFSVDENKSITETDRFSWMPDCLTEYQDYVQKNGEVSVKDNLIVFCLDSAAVTPYTWQQMHTGFGDHAELYEYYDCSKETEIPLDGGTIHLLKVFQATKDGYVTIGLEYRDDLIDESDKPAEKSLVADCVIIDDAKSVLLADTACFSITDSKTGKLVDIDENDKIFLNPDIRYSAGEEGIYASADIASVQMTENPFYWDIAQYKDADKFEVGLLYSNIPDGCFVDTESTVVRKFDNGAMDYTFKLKKVVSGDANGDGEFNVADVVSFQKWLLAAPDAQLTNWKAVDFCNDNRLNAFDLCLMKRELVRKTATTYVVPDEQFEFGVPFRVAEDGLKLYLGPDESYEAVASIPADTRLIEKGVQNGNNEWLFTEYNGQYGWINTLDTEGKLVIYFEEATKKPVIYLYPEEETDVHVELELTESELNSTYPKYNNGWDIIASTDGTLLNKADGSHHRYLFWDAVNCRTRFDFSKGFCVAGSDTESFLKEKLTYMGLTEEEMNDFIVYWLPLMEHNAYNLISFQGEAYTNSAKLNIVPEPDSECRIFMAYVPLDNTVEIEPQQLEKFERTGFSVVEWGGAELRQ